MDLCCRLLRMASRCGTSSHAKNTQHSERASGLADVCFKQQMLHDISLCFNCSIGSWKRSYEIVLHVSNHTRVIRGQMIVPVALVTFACSAKGDTEVWSIQPQKVP